MSSDESDGSTSKAKASSYDPFEATVSAGACKKTGVKVDLTEKSSPALLNLISSYQDQHDSESSCERDGNKKPISAKKTERSDDSDSSSSPARKSRKTSTKRNCSAGRHSRREKSRSKRRRFRSPTAKHHHRRRSSSRRRHKRRSSRSKFRHRDSSSSSEHSREHSRPHCSPKRQRRRSSSRRYHQRSRHHYYRPNQERKAPHRQPPPIHATTDCPKQPKLAVAQPEPIHHYYVPHMGNQTSYTQPTANSVIPRHRANLIEIIPTQANLSSLTEVNAKKHEEPVCHAATIGSSHSKDLSDYLVEEMLLEEEVKQKEQRKIAEEKAAERLLVSECERLLDDLIELLCVVEHVCEDANWQEPKMTEEIAVMPPVKQRPVVSWLCQVNVDELNGRSAESEAAERNPSQSSSKVPVTPVWPDTSILDGAFRDQACADDEDSTVAENGRQLVDQWLEKDNKPSSQSTNGIDELMQRIFKGRNTDERIVSWISRDDVCPADNIEPEEQSSGGDEPYDPEVEEARLSNRDDTARKHIGTEVIEHVPPLAIEELPSSATELYRIQKYRQKKQRMEQVIAVAKECIKPRYVKREIDKEQYKMVMKKTVDKYMQSGRPVNKEKISQLINYYIAADDRLT